MYIWGKLIGMAFGFSFLGIPGLILGLLIGQVYDSVKTIQGSRRRGDSQSQNEDLVPHLFALFGRISASGGVITAQQVFFLQSSVLSQLNISIWDQQRAVAAFKTSINSPLDPVELAQKIGDDFFLDYTMRGWILANCRRLAALGQITPQTADLLDRIALALGLEPDQQDAFESGPWSSSSQQSSSSHGSRREPLWVTEDDYKALGLASTASDDEIKKAYRSLARQHHPDAHAHLADESPEKKLSEAKFIQIQNSYDRIKKTRHF